MAIETDQAIVLRLSDYSESSQIATLFTASHGLVRLMAKGAKRGAKQRPAVGLDLLELGDAAFALARGEAGLGTLTEWKQLDAFLGLRRALEPLNAAIYIAEITPAVTVEHDPSPALFEALRAALTTLAASDPQTDAFEALVRYQAAALRMLGQTPNLRECVVCGRARPTGKPASFSSAAGGLLCSTCAPRQPERLRLSARFLDAGREAPPREWFSLLDYHLSHIAGRPFRASRPFAASGPPRD